MLMRTLLLALLRGYKLAISPLLGQRCRFYPSCSDYARDAIQSHGAAHGSYLAARRLCRCHPFSAGGIDLVPEPMPSRMQQAGPLKSVTSFVASISPLKWFKWGFSPLKPLKSFSHDKR